MQLTKLYFKDKSTGWCLQEAEFSPFTLLVGASGVGKTRILQAIEKIASIATGDSYNGVAWKATFYDDAYGEIVWQGETEFTKEKYDYSQMPYEFFGKFDDELEFNFLSELLLINGIEIFKRENGDASYKGNKTVKLQKSKSLFHLLQENEIVSLKEKFIHINDSEFEFLLIPDDTTTFFEGITSIDVLSKFYFNAPLSMLYVVSKQFNSLFEQIKEEFCSIFPFVEDLQFINPQVFKNAPVNTRANMLALHLKERNSDIWIGSWDFSSGMKKTLALLTHLFLSPKGSILLIDEFENSFGVNCIESISKIVIHSAQDKQIVLTSHHPYIINNIPSEHWKLVTRKNSNVSISSVQDKLSTRSKHDAFMQLINLDQYAEGIES